MEPLRFHEDESRAVLRIGGADARGFLQDLVTNDLRRLAPGTAVYAALLTPQGKYLADFVLVAEGEDILLDVASPLAEGLAGRLGLYRLRRQVTIGPAGRRVLLVQGGAGAVPQGVAGAADPRHPALGLRLYLSPGADPAVLLPGAVAEDAAARAALRVALGIPETLADLEPGETFILEAGFERLNGVDFRKGCYVGQEVTARMKHKAELRRGLVRVRVEGEAPPPGTPVMSGDREAGRLGSVAGGEGLALLRLDRAEGPLTAGAARLARIG